MGSIIFIARLYHEDFSKYTSFYPVEFLHGLVLKRKARWLSRQPVNEPHTLLLD